MEIIQTGKDNSETTPREIQIGKDNSNTSGNKKQQKTTRKMQTEKTFRTNTNRQI